MIKLRAAAQYDLIWPSSEYVYRLNATRACWRSSTARCCGTRTSISSFYDSPLVGPELRVLGAVRVLHDRHRLAERHGLGDDRLLERPLEPRRRRPDVHPRRLPGGDRRGEPDQRLLPEHGGAGRARGLEGDAARPEGERARLLDELRRRTWSAAAPLSTRPGTGTSSTSETRWTTPRTTATRPATRACPSGPTRCRSRSTPARPGTAMLFMDWILTPENACQNVNWNGYPQPVRGRQRGLRQAGQGGALDRRRPRRARERRGVPPRRRRARAALDRDLHRGQGDVTAAGASGTRFLAPGRALARCCCSPSRSASCWRSRSGTWTTSGGPSTRSTSTTTPTPSIPPTCRSCCAPWLYAFATAALCLAIGYPIAYYIARFGGR